MDLRRRNARMASARSLLIVTAMVVMLSSHGGAILGSAFTAPTRGQSLSLFPEVRALARTSTSSTASAVATTTRRCRYGGESCRWATIPKQASTATTTSEGTSNSVSLPSPEKQTNSSKLRQLKDRMWVRETLEDITAAEFASSLSVEMEEVDNHDASSSSSNGNNNTGPLNNNGQLASMTKYNNGANKLSPPPRRKRAVDFDNILKKLDSRIEAMCIITTPESAQRLNQTCHIIDRRIFSGVEEGDSEDQGEVTCIENACYCLDENVGMGSVVYTPQQREALLSRLISTRVRLVNFIEVSSSEGSWNGGRRKEDSIDDIRSQLLPTENTSTSSKVDSSAAAESLSSTIAAASFDPSLYVREDGTVDWDGALQDREALKKFGSAVWSRINGQDPEEADENANGAEGNGVVSSKPGGGEDNGGSGALHSPTKAVTAKIEETDAIREKREQLNALMSELQQMEVEHIKLLNLGEWKFIYSSL